MPALSPSPVPPQPAPDAEYRPLTLADIGAAAEVVAEAYLEDPLCAFMLPRRGSRRATLYRVFRVLGEINILNQRGYGAGDPLAGVAYWKSPDGESMSISLSFLPKLVPLLLTAYPLGLFRARAVLNRIERLHERHAPEPHFYLDNLAVRPSAQGQGLASRLVRPFLVRADAIHVSVYTDTVTHANVAMYEHFGFECVESSSIPGTGLTVWALRRPAI